MQLRRRFWCDVIQKRLSGRFWHFRWWDSGEGTAVICQWVLIVGDVIGDTLLTGVLINITTVILEGGGCTEEEVFITKR